jgi:hypothetical protein
MKYEDQIASFKIDYTVFGGNEPKNNLVHIVNSTMNIIEGKY